MLRAVPAIIRTACSTSRALRSSIFILAISSSWALRDLADLVLVRHARALGQAGRLLQQHRRRRALGDEVERAVVVDVHHHRDHHPAGFLRPLVELLDELAQVDAVLAERSADRRRRRRLPAGDLKLRLCRLIALP